MKTNNVPEKDQEKQFSLILKRPGNQQCADCSVKAPTWVSTEFGILICINCAGVHRSLGPKITRVRSIKLDGWSQDQINLLEQIGNEVANSYWENQIQRMQINKPTSKANPDTLLNYVNNKYIKKLYIPQNAVDPKCAAQNAKKQLKPHYFDHQSKPEEEINQTRDPQKQNDILGDLLDIDNEDEKCQEQFTETTQLETISSQPNETHAINQRSNQSQKGSISVDQSSFNSLIPEQKQVMSTQSLKLLSMYNQPQSNDTNSEMKINKYSHLYNHDIQQSQDQYRKIPSIKVDQTSNDQQQYQQSNKPHKHGQAHSDSNQK